MEKRGKDFDEFLLRAKASSGSDLSVLHGQYFERYDHLVGLSPGALQAILIEKDRHVQMLAGMVGTAVNKPHINTYHSQGDTTVGEQGAKYNLSRAQFAGGFAETVQGDQVGGTINNQAAQSPSLSEAVAEIQQLLKQLESSNPTATELDRTAFLNAMIPPTRRERFISAAQSVGSVVLDETLYGRVLKALVDGWQNPQV